MHGRGRRLQPTTTAARPVVPVPRSDSRAARRSRRRFPPAIPLARRSGCRHWAKDHGEGGRRRGRRWVRLWSFRFPGEVGKAERAEGQNERPRTWEGEAPSEPLSKLSRTQIRPSRKHHISHALTCKPTLDLVVKRLPEPTHDRAGPTTADKLFVDPYNREHLDRRSEQNDLIGCQELRKRDARGDERNADRLGQSK